MKRKYVYLYLLGLLLFSVALPVISVITIPICPVSRMMT